MICTLAIVLATHSDTDGIGWVAITTLIFSGIAACGGIISAVYSANAAREKANRELLASKLESLYKNLMEEFTQILLVIDLVDKKLKQGTPPKKIYDDNEEKLRSVWSEQNEGEILVSLYFPELMDGFRDFRSHRSQIGTIFRHLASAPFADAVGAEVMPVADKMTDACNKLRLQMAGIAS